jgi:hypothetical protein
MALIRDNFLFDVFLKRVISHILKINKMHVRFTYYKDICQFNRLN